MAFGRTLWGHKLLVLLMGGLCGLGAAVYALNAPSIYHASVVVTPVHDEATTGGGLTSQLGAITSLVGVNLGQANNAGLEAAAVLDSRRLVEEFIRRNDLLPELSRNAKKPLTLWRAVSLFKDDVLTIRQDARKGLTTIAVEWTDPGTAARWANQLVALANELIRRRAIEDASRDIDYLNRQIAQTNAVEMRQALYDIIKSETKTLMLANGRSEYAFETVDPAVAPDIKVRPHRVLITLGGVGSGLVLGGMVALLIDRTRRRRNNVAPVRAELLHSPNG